MIQDYTAINELLKQLEENKTLQTTVIILVIINILIEIAKFLSNIYLTNKTNSASRKLLLEERKINILETLFKKLNGLSLYDRDESELLLKEIKETNNFIYENKIYIPNSFQKISQTTLDYFTQVLTDYRSKSIEKENKLYNKFCDEFNK